MDDGIKNKRVKSKQALPVKVEFHGVILEGVFINGKNYVAMKPIVEGMGLKWNDQLEKMKKHPVLKDEVSPISGIPSAGGAQTMICLPENRLQFWMAIINNGVDINSPTAYIQQQGAEHTECIGGTHSRQTSGFFTPVQARSMAGVRHSVRMTGRPMPSVQHPGHQNSGQFELCVGA